LLKLILKRFFFEVLNSILIDFLDKAISFVLTRKSFANLILINIKKKNLQTCHIDFDSELNSD